VRARSGRGRFAPGASNRLKPPQAKNNRTVEHEATLNALAVEAFNDLLKKHGKRQSVQNTEKIVPEGQKGVGGVSNELASRNV
jgi:hypothetical protein